MKRSVAIFLVFTVLFPLISPSIVGAKNPVLSDAIPMNKKGVCTPVPEINVPNDISVVENTQKSVDQGHSPWNLDPASVAQVFASLQLSPGGIVGDYPIEYDYLKVIKQSNADAIVQVINEKSAIARIYLKRLVRQDPTGVWTVVGYDLKK